MSISNSPGHMQSVKLSFSATVLTLGLKAFSEIYDFVKRKFWWELRTRPTLDRYVAAPGHRSVSLNCLNPPPGGGGGIKQCSISKLNPPK